MGSGSPPGWPMPWARLSPSLGQVEPGSPRPRRGPSQGLTRFGLGPASRLGRGARGGARNRASAAEAALYLLVEILWHRVTCCFDDGAGGSRAGLKGEPRRTHPPSRPSPRPVPPSAHQSPFASGAWKSITGRRAGPSAHSDPTTRLGFEEPVIRPRVDFAFHEAAPVCHPPSAMGLGDRCAEEADYPSRPNSKSSVRSPVQVR